MAVTLSSTKAPLASAYYRLGQFGIETKTVREDHGTYLYPTYRDVNPAGIFTVWMGNSATGDFNGDGFEDVVVGWLIYPHTITRQTEIRMSVYFNDGQGGLRLASSSEVAAVKAVQQPYRLAVGDLNGDGVKDIVQSSMGLYTRNSDGTFTTKFDPLLILLSAPGGKLIDGASRIQGQENGEAAAGYEVGHDLSLGDVDGDGDLDIYSAKVLFLNDGKANFTNAGQPLTNQERSHTILTASAMGDFDNDGKADIVMAHLDGTLAIAFSRFKGATPGWAVAALPAGLYGANTRPNAAASGDVNGDGLLDIIIAETRADPYYVGAAIQILINKGGGQFVDETASRINNSARDTFNGEGQLDVRDIDGDGDLDIIHSVDRSWDSAGTLVSGGLSVAVNNGRGVFTWLPSSVFPQVQSYQLAGYEGLEANLSTTVLPRMIPVDIDKSGALDFVAAVQTPFTRWPTTEPSQYTTYTLINTATPQGMSTPVVSLATSAILRQTNAALSSDLSAQVTSGALSASAAIEAIVKAAGASTSVATLSYQFFTGKIPSLGGVDYLVSPTGPNPNNLNSAYYQTFNLENRYINFAVNLGKIGEGNTKFTADYGSLTLFEATRKAYATIFGGTPNDAKVHALIDSRVDYFAYYGGDGANGIGTKAAMVGWLLAEAQKADLGVMVRSNDAWLTDLSDGSAPFAIDLLDPAKGYYKADFIFGGG